MIKGQKPRNYESPCVAILVVAIMASAVLNVHSRSSIHAPSCPAMLFVRSWEARPRWRHFKASKLSGLKLQLSGYQGSIQGEADF